MKNKFKTGQIIKHKRTRSVWLIHKVCKPKEIRYSDNKIHMTQQIDATCFYTGSSGKKSYWIVGQPDSWVLDIDDTGSIKYFEDQWKIISRD